MSTLEFLKAVWPDTGFYCIAYPSTGKGYSHRVFETIEEAAACVPQLSTDKNVYFAVHTLKAHQVWNERARRDKETKEWVADWSYRLQTNMRAAKCFFFDLDVGVSTKTLEKYETQRDAAVDLMRFCDVTKLPVPLVTSSGNGLHVYWLLQDEVPSDEWITHAENLHALARHHGLRVDASRTSDTSSLLRVVGSDNLKVDGRRLPCVAKTKAKATPTADFLKLLTDLLNSEKIVSKRRRKASTPKEDDILGSNMQREEMSPVTIQALGKACPQVRAYVKARGEVGYALWHMILGLLRHVENGREWAHKVSAGPTYDAEACDDKLDEQEAKDIGPTSCHVIDQVSGNDLCKTCFYWGKVKCPMVAARWPQPAKEEPEPPEPEPGEPEPPRKRLKTPAGFYLTESGHIAQYRKNKDGVQYPHVILRHDLYPSLRQVDGSTESDQHEWNTKLPFEQPKTFLLESGVIQQDKVLATKLSKQGIYVFPDDVKAVQTFMSAYTQDLLADIAAEVQYGHVGWNKDRTSFITHDKILHRDGTTTKASLNREAQVGLLENRGVGRMGTLQRQIELTEFYNKPEYLPHQFYILCGLASPILFATGHHGVIINATGEKGSSKSSALALIGSFWGSPIKYPMSALKKGVSQAALSLLADILSNYPVALDEITNMTEEVAKEFSLGVSQANNQETATRDRKLRQTSGGNRSTFWMTTSNKPLQAIISQNNPSGTAGAARIIEVPFPLADKRNKIAADQWLYDLSENHGHIGEVVMRYIVQNMDSVAKRVRAEMAELDRLGDIEPGERFWSTPAAGFVMGDIGNELGAIKYDVQAIRDWYITTQLPHMRGVLREEYPTPLSVLSSYIDKISGNIITATKSGNIARVPTGAVYGRYEMDICKLWLSRDAFKDHCRSKNADYMTYVNELVKAKIILEPQARKALGHGTELAKGRSYCIMVDLAHPDTADLEENVRSKFKVA